MAIITVALAGTPEAATADFVCDGSDDNVEIAAAIAQLASLGGGTLQIAGGIYSTSRPIVVEHDNIAIVGAANQSTIIRPAANWVSIFTVGGAQPTGVVSFVGVDNFAARNLVVESTTLPMNGIIAIPDGPEGTGAISTNGTFDNNVVRMAQAHTYSIWSLLSTGMTITNNLVDGGATLTNASISQEGIEIFGGDNIVISGNTVINMGNAAINLVSLSEILPDTHLTNIQVTDNIIDFSRIGVFVGSTYSSLNGPANISNLLIDGNMITNGFEGGIFVEMQDGILTDPVLLDTLTISNNQVEVLANRTQGFITSAIYFDGKNGDGLNTSSNVNIVNNQFALTTTTDTLPSPSRISTANSRFVIFYNIEGVVFADNVLTSDVENFITSATSTILSEGIDISRNDISGFLGFGMEVSNSSNILIDENRLLEWGGFVDYFAILVAGSSDVAVSANDVESPANFQGPIAANIFSTNVSFTANRVIADRDFSIAGTNYRDLLLTNGGILAVGSSADNYIEGNASGNTLDGGVGVDTMAGLGGDDIYIVDNAADVVVEAVGGGIDEVRASVSYALGAGVEVERLSTTNAAGTGALNLTGNALVQEITGNAGANTLDGGGGADTLRGLGGNDIYLVGDSAVVIVEAAAGGSDEVRATVNYTLDSEARVERLVTGNAAGTGALDLAGNAYVLEIIGNAGVNALTGGSGNNLLDGGAGADTLTGLGGDDVYIVDNAGDVVVEAAAGGNDEIRSSVSYTLGSDVHVERLITSNAAGIDALNLTGNAHVLELVGNAGVNALTGGGGANTLDGSAGADTLAGLGGDDIYIVDNAADVVAEATGEGSDEVRASVSYVLGAGAEVERLATTNAAGTGALNLTGNEFAQEITGNAGANSLDGSTGADTLIGLGGNDIYFVDDAGDAVIEAAGAGSDEVRAAVSYALASDAHVERLVTGNAAGTNAIDLTGNAHVLELVGNAGVNALTGGSGNNLLDGGAGADTLTGLGGNDVYLVDDAGDAVVEAAGAGNDEVRASVSYVLGTGVEVEKLATTDAGGSAALNLTGNALVQEITGNAGANTLDGGGGADILRGLGGDDIYVIDNAGVTAVEANDSGYDTISASINYTLSTALSIELLKAKDAAATTALNLTGNELANRLEGNAGANVLNGGGGIDVLAGLGGNDTYYLDHADDQIIEGSNEGTRDVAVTSVSYTLGVGVGVEILSVISNAATTALNLTGNAFANHLVGNAGSNILDGGGTISGRDQLQGLGGDDIYIIRKGDEVIYEGIGEGTDEVRSAVNFTLTTTAQIERIATIDAAATTALTLRGNELVQTITGNAGANILDGGGAADTLTGLGGDDVYIVDNVADQIVEVAGEGSDEVQTSVSYALAAEVHVEKLLISNAAGTAALDLTGNALVQELVGNAGTNILDGGGGADVLRGLAGNDVYVVDDAADQIIEIAGGGVDEVRASVSYALAVEADIEKLATIDSAGIAALNLTGNALAQDITGNAGANMLDGGAGADMLTGLGGDDIYLVDDAADVVVEATGGGSDEVRASVSYTLGNSVEVERLATTSATGIGAINLTGNALVQEIIGNAGANTLDGGGGADTLSGLGGDDSYLVDAVTVTIVEGADGGSDSVWSSVDFTLATGVSVEFLRARDALATTALNLTGNAFDQEIVGNAGANLLGGGGGADVLRGLGGDDIYLVDSLSDQVLENSGEGLDEVRASSNFVLTANSEVERLIASDANSSNALDLTGNEFAQEITGNAGANRLDGGASADTLSGLGGNDIYIVDDAGDIVVETVGGGSDEVRASASYTLGTGAEVERLMTTDVAGIGLLNLTGNALVQEITGNAGANTLDGGGGADTLRGLGGDDVYVIDNSGVTVVEAAGAGYDTIATSLNYTLATGLSIELLKAKDAASTANLNLTGNGFANRLEGNAGANVLNGGAGIDVLAGLGGSDIYYLDHVDDQIIEGNDEGTSDVAYSSVSYTLGAGVAVEFLSTITHAATTALNLTGNALRNQLIGNAGANILDGGGASTGRDTLQGLGGDDIYIVRQGNEIINEAAGGGSDEVRAAVSYTLAAAEHVERVATIDAAATTALTLRGNELAQEIIGNAGANTLDGGAGADILTGLNGDDIYVIDNVGDQIVEAAANGFDEAQASISYTLAADVHVERLTTINVNATTAINLTANALTLELVGNAGANTLTGNALANTLDGKAGADNLIGLGGDDVYLVDNAADVVVEAMGEGSDEVRASASYALGAGVEVERLMTGSAIGITAINLTGNELAQEITGNAGANMLDGGAGADTLTGLGGDDIYFVDDAADIVVEAAAGGSDEVRASVNYTLGTGVEVERLATTNVAGTAALNLTGNALVQDITGNAGANILDGGGGADTLRGLGGDDVYSIDNAGVALVEAVGAGYDTVVTSLNYTLGTGLSIELLKLKDAVATTALNLTGNELANRLEGNAGTNVLNGGTGIDVLAGLGGNDIYYLDDAGDQIIEASDEGANDVAYSSVSYSLGAGVHVEILSTITHAATDAISLTGNALRNTLIGNAGANILDGGGASNGRDTLQGFGGDDVYIIRQGDEIIYEGAGGGTDEVRSAVNFILTGTVQVERIATIDASASTALTLRGNELAQDITGNAGANTLEGSGGADALRGLEGNDSLVGGTGIDIAHYRGLRAQYSIITGSGSVQIVDNDVVLDGDDGTDTLVGVEFAEFKNGEQVGLMSPIILDLDGMGVQTLSASQSNSRFDMDGDGIGDDSSWFGATEGLLVLDRDGNGTLSDAGEFSFVGDVEDARSDLEGLRAHDSNGDGVLSELDARFADFLVWADRNGDGSVDAGEMMTLTEAGVASIDLAGQGVEATTGLDEVAVINKGSYTRIDGSTMEFLDVALTYSRGEAVKTGTKTQAVSANPEADRAVALLQSQPLKAPDIQIADLLAAFPDVVASDGASGTKPPAPRLDFAQLTDAAIPLLLQINQTMASFAPGAGETDKGGATETVKPLDYFT